ncbi:MAG: enoyl-CoA hydratase/isomerase family protein [Actinomycetota bacterium]
MSEPRFVSLERDERIALVTLRRPEALNAISGAVADELAGVFGSVARDEDVWVVVVTASGERAFCVGADLKERASFSRADFHGNRGQIRSMFAALRAVPQPTIASIFGFAFGGGFELALTCDIVLAADDLEVGLTETRVGLVPAGGGTQLLARRVGPSRAKELVFTGRRLGAQEAAELGLVERIVPRADLDAATKSLARDICASSPVAVRAAKAAIDESWGRPLEDGMAVEHGEWSIVVESADRAEGIAAFNAKRDARWSNR